MGKKWNDTETELLRKNLGETSASLLPFFPKRTIMAIARKKESLGWHRPKYIAPRLSDVERGYFAGLVDGEGCFVFHRRIKRFINTSQWVFRLTITNSNVKLLENLQQTCQGGFIAELRDKRRIVAGYKKCYSLNFSSDHLRGLLPQILDVLIDKRMQAQLILKALASMGNGGRRTNHKEVEHAYGEFKNLVTILVK